MGRATRTGWKRSATDRRSTLQAMTPLEDAQEFVLGSCPPRATVTMRRRRRERSRVGRPGRVAEVVPPFDNTAVDGYAVRSADVATAAAEPVELIVAGEIAAGAAPDRPVGPGEAIRIMTGAPMPDGADAVVMVEDSERLDAGDDGVERVRLSARVPAGAAVRRAGDDVQVGDEIFPAGVVITPAIQAVLASVNAAEVAVFPRLTVAVLSTGDELIDDGSPLELGQIRESNKTMLAGMLAETGCEVVDLGVVRDDEAELERVLRGAAETCDAIVSSGGVSMGDYDVVKAVLGRIADMTWMQMAIKPAKPFAFGTLAGPSGAAVPIFGLPGNPVSSLVSYELMARPGAAAHDGSPPAHPDQPRRRSRTSTSAAARTARSISLGSPASSVTMAGITCVRSARRAVTNSPQRHRPTRWPSSPMVTASLPVPTSPSSSSTDLPGRVRK